MPTTTQQEDAMQQPMMPGQPSPQGQPAGNTVTLDMTPGAITITSAAGVKQCESIGECLQTLLEMYEAAAGDGEGAEAGQAALMSGYDEAPQSRPMQGERQ